MDSSALPRKRRVSACVTELSALVVCVALGSLSGVLSKLRGDQLREYDGLCGVMSALGSVVGYAVVLQIRSRQKMVTPEMLRFVFVTVDDGRARRSTRAAARWWRAAGAHKYLMVAGFVDQVGRSLWVAAQPKASPVVVTLLSATSALWAAAGSCLALGGATKGCFFDVSSNFESSSDHVCVTRPPSALRGGP